MPMLSDLPGIALDLDAVPGLPCFLLDFGLVTRLPGPCSLDGIGL